MVVTVDEPCDLGAGLGFGGEAASGQQLPFEGGVETFRRSIIQCRPDPSHRLDHPQSITGVSEEIPTYSPPLSVWKITPEMVPPRVAAAMHRAARASRESWCSPIANPGIRREAKSSTVAKYSLPSSVGISVRSPHHLWLIAEALKPRLTRSGIGAAALSGRVATDERERLKQLEREVRELRRANEILKAASAFFASMSS